MLRDGMYGRAVIILQKATPHLTVPSTALLDRDSEGKGTVEVVRDGKLYRQSVIVGRDNGTLAEIISGLEPDAQVIVKPDVSMADGTPVQCGIAGHAGGTRQVASGPRLTATPVRGAGVQSRADSCRIESYDGLASAPPPHP